MLSYSADLFRRVAPHRELLLSLTREELRRPFAGSVLGLAWVLFHPLASMAVYIAVFAFLFRIRLGAGEDYVVYVLAGLLSWTAWAHVVTASCQAVAGNVSLVKQAHFPLEILPIRTVLVALVPQAVAILVVCAYRLVRSGTASWLYLLLPLAVALQALSMLGAAYLLATVSVFLRDMKELATLFVTLGIYLVPAFYPPAMIEGMPPLLKWILLANPFTVFLNLFRDCLVWSEIRHTGSWAAAAVAAVVLPGLAHRLFHRLRTFFGNYL